MYRLSLVLIITAILVTTGCAQRMLDGTLVSTKNIPAATINIAENVTVRDAEAKSSTTWFFCFPLGRIANVEDAIDDVLARGQGDYLTNPVISYEWLGIPGILWVQTFSVKGDVHSIKTNTPEELARIQREYAAWRGKSGPTRRNQEQKTKVAPPANGFVERDR